MAKHLLENETYWRVMSTCKSISLFIYIMTCSFYPETTLGQNLFSKGEGERSKLAFVNVTFEGQGHKAKENIDTICHP